MALPVYAKGQEGIQSCVKMLLRFLRRNAQLPPLKKKQPAGAKTRKKPHNNEEVDKTEIITIREDIQRWHSRTV
jgi:hypothetical protein